jgi:V-type H+-transporting ATPase subunit A
MKRTVLIGNTSNMPVAAREASVYTGITVSEYFRDQGKNAAMIADSTSRWAEALREISGRLEEMPGESGFPPYLGAKLASFYERAGLATARGLPVRRGSVSIVGAVSPAGGDFSEPVTQSTLNIVQAFWGLDKALAQRKHFPSVNVHASWTKYTDPLREYYQEHRPEFPGLRDRIKALLASFKEVEEAISLVGPDGLTGQDRVVYFLGKLVMDDFLQQNGFSPYDQFCPLWKTEWIMKAMMAYYDELQMAVSRGMSVPKIIGATNDIRTRVQSMKFELPSDGEEAVTKKYEKIMEDMSSKFASLDIE